MSFNVTILGSSSATPTSHRHPTSQVLTYNEQLFLIDCGEATQMQLTRYKVKAHKINHIFISHLHGDHYLGLIGLLSTLHLQGRTNPLNLFGPPELKEILDVQFLHSQTELRYPLIFHPIQDTESEVILKLENIQVSTIILNHRIACTGFLFREINKPYHLRKDKLAEGKVPVEAFSYLKKGQDYKSEDGRDFLVQDYTTAPDKALSYAFCSDTIYDKRVIDAVQGVSLLYHEATFMEDMIDRATETYHSTARQAGMVATQAGVNALLIGHFSARYRDLNPLLEEAKSAFLETSLAIEGLQFIIK